MRSWFAIKNLVAVAAIAAAAGATAATNEVSVYDEIGGFGITAKDYMDAFNAMPEGPVVLNINSPGGSVFDALTMMNGMRASGRQITTRVMGVAASAASLIAMAGNTIEMPANSFMMLHAPMTGTYGNADEMRSTADMLDTIGKSLQATYVTRSGADPEKIAAILAKDTWLSADECKELGLCDTVTPAVDVKALFDPDQKHIPANVQAMLRGKPPAANANPPKPGEPAATFSERVNAALVAAGLTEFGGAFVLDAAITTDESLATAIGEAREIVALCKVLNQPDAAKAAISARKPLATLRSELIAAKAEADAKLALTAVPPKPANPAAKGEGKGLSVTSYWAAQHKAQHEARVAAFK